MHVSKQTFDHQKWMYGNEAARALGIGMRAFPAVAARLGIPERRIPGRRGWMFSRPHVEEVVKRLEREEAERIAAAQAAPIVKRRPSARPRRARPKNTVRSATA